jgi:hypothetical protein
LARRPFSAAAVWRRALPVCGLLLIALSNVALAQQYPPSSGGLAVSTSEASPGAEVTISGGGYAPNSDVTVTFESVPVVLAVVRADASGQFSARVRIPVDATPGTHTLRATGVDAQGRPRVLSATINVTGGQAPPAGTTSGGGAGSHRGALVRTGPATVVPVSIAGAALIAAGALLLLQVRREAQPTGLR